MSQIGWVITDWMADGTRGYWFCGELPKNPTSRPSVGMTDDIEKATVFTYQKEAREAARGVGGRLKRVEIK